MFRIQSYNIKVHFKRIWWITHNLSNLNIFIVKIHVYILDASDNIYIILYSVL